MKETKPFNLLTNFLIMKNIFLAFVFIYVTSTFSYCQEKINTDDLIGYWQPDIESTNLFFWKDSKGELKMQEISQTSGKPLELISLRVNYDSIFTRVIFMPTNWVTESTYKFIDKNKLECVLTGDGNGTLVYKKIK